MTQDLGLIAQIKKTEDTLRIQANAMYSAVKLLEKYRVMLSEEPNITSS